MSKELGRLKLLTEQQGLVPNRGLRPNLTRKQMARFRATAVIEVVTYAVDHRTCRNLAPLGAMALPTPTEPRLKLRAAVKRIPAEQECSVSQHEAVTARFI